MTKELFSDPVATEPPKKSLATMKEVEILGDKLVVLTKAMIFPAIVAIMRAIEPITKSQHNEEQNYNFRGVEQVYNAVHPHFAEHGVFSTSTVLETTFNKGASKNGTPYHHAILKMRFTFYAEDGSSVSTEVVGEGMDYSGDKASNKAMSAADKYAILQLLKIPTATVESDRAQEHDNPDHDEDAPKSQPRGERVGDAKVLFILKEWKEQQPEDERTPAAWNNFVLRATGREFNPRKSGEWSVEDYRKVCVALSIPE